MVEMNERGFPVYDRQPAWQGVGTSVMEASTAQEALAMAKMGWEVAVEPSYYAIPNLKEPEEVPVFRPSPKARLVVRKDLPPDCDARVLGQVGPAYTPIQNVDAFSLFDSLQQEGELAYEASGVLRGGAVCWLLARIPGDVIVGGDEIRQYMMIRNVHDGTGSLEILLTPHRLVCFNAISLARKKSKLRINIPHTRRADLKLGESERLLVGAKKYFAEHMEILEKLQRTKLSDSTVTRFLLELYPLPPSNRRSQLSIDARTQIHSLYVHADENHKGNAYGLWQAVTEYIDHASGGRINKAVNPFEARMNSLMWGSKAAKRQEAGALILQACEVGDVDSDLDSMDRFVGTN